MNKFPLTKKEIVDFFNKQKKLISSSEIIDLKYSNGRILAEDLKSQINLPPFNNSAVDGYALIRKDLNLKKINKLKLYFKNYNKKYIKMDRQKLL